MINLELYRVFYAVAVEKNITKASEILNISQPAVTKHIKNLEDALNSPLFIRTKKGVVLNEYGEKLFIKIKQALALIDDGEREVNHLNNNYIGTIKIGISTSLTKKFLFNHIKKFHKLYPNVIVTINTDPTKELIKQLKSGNIDFIISKFPGEKDMDLNYIKLGNTKYIFAASNDYKELKNKSININDLIKYPLLFQKKPSNSRTNVEKYLKDNNISIEPKMNIGSSNLLVEFTKIGYGIGYLTQLYIEEELENKTLFEINVKPSTSEITYGIISLKNNVFPSYCSKFIDYLVDNHK